MDDLTCAVCSEVYEIKIREPITLPKCGHTFCRSCLSSLQSLALLFKCPTCRTIHNGAHISSLPPVYVVLNILDRAHSIDKVAVIMCKTHDDPVRLWCRPCQEELCGQCLFEHHMSDEHDVVKTQDAVDEMKKTMEAQTEQLTDCIKQEKSQLIREFHSIAFQLGKLYSRSQALKNNSKTVKDVLQIIKETSQIKTLARNHDILESMIRDFSKILKIEENFPSEHRRSSPCSTIFTDNVDEQCGDSNSDKAIIYEGDFHVRDKNESENSTTLDFYEDDSDSGQDDPEENRLQPSTSRRTDSPVTTYSDVSVWPLTCHAPGGERDWPKVSWYNFIDQVPVVQLLVPPENPEVYLQLEVNGKNLGRLHIRLWGYLRRAQNFLALCLGTLGPSYKGSKFSHVAKIGEPGERLIGGFYETKDGYSGHQVIEGLEWRGEFTGPMRAGIIGGTRGRQPDYNSCFCISTRDYSKGKYYCPFGEVVSGLEVAQEAIHYEPISDVTITDVGLVLPQHSL